MKGERAVTRSTPCPECSDLLPSSPGNDLLCPACVAATLLETETQEPAPRDLGQDPLADHLELSSIEIPGFELLGLVGRGSMGVVYRARQSSPQREVAVKVLSAHGVITSDQARQRFAREVELAGRLRHPGIVPIYESGLAKSDGVLYYTMELVEGVPLDHFLAKHDPSQDARLHLFEKVCAAVVYAHQQGVIHRDLTPGNILVESDGNPRLLDFGLGKNLQAAGPDANPQLSLHDHILGSPSTMSPEQAAGRADVDTRSDVYSLGAILYFLLAGHWPHHQEGDLLDVLHRIAHEPARPAARFAPNLASGLRAILDKALATDPDQRYQSAAHLAVDLGRFRRKEELSVQPLTRWQRLALWRQRRPIHAALWAVPAEMRDNIVKRQREVLDGTVSSQESEPVETARKLLEAWGYPEMAE